MARRLPRILIANSQGHKVQEATQHAVFSTGCYSLSVTEHPPGRYSVTHRRTGAQICTICPSDIKRARHDLEQAARHSLATLGPRWVDQTIQAANRRWSNLK